MINSPAADITKALRPAIKEENIPQVRKILLDPQLFYITTSYSAFAAPLEKVVKKGNSTLVQIIVEAIQKRYQHKRMLLMQRLLLITPFS